MELNKEKLEELRKDPLMRLLSNVCGLNYDELVDSAIKESEKVPEENIDKEVDEALKELIDLGVIREAGKNDNGDIVYEVLPINKSKEENKKPLETTSDKLIDADSCGTRFTMSEEKLAKWIEDYRELENIFSKLSYLYGISFKGGTNGIYERYNNLVWTLIESIFGEDNREDIADYVFGNSNFDSVKDLYAELT